MVREHLGRAQARLNPGHDILNLELLKQAYDGRARLVEALEGVVLLDPGMVVAMADP